MSVHANPLVAFLSAYGPHPSANSIYDEFVVDAARKQGCAPIEIPQPLIDDLVAMLSRPAPVSVILTGTAGDGKTYTARRVLERLSDGQAAWGSTEKELAVAVAGRRIRFVKDLSELNETDKDGLFDDVCAALRGEADATPFVICVNDGHLLRFFREREGKDGALPAQGSLYHRLREMLRGDEQDDPDGHFRLVNMSRRPHDALIDAILSGITDHGQWGPGCAGCPALADTGRPCPIRLNREVLAQRGQASMRARLKDLIRMAAANGAHLPIRQLILLTVNVLLGDRGPDRDMMTCAAVQGRGPDWSYRDTNPYASVMGDNLAEADRRRYAAFTVLGSFGIGRETNNWYDETLLDLAEGADDPEADTLPDHDFYGIHLLRQATGKYALDPARHVEALRAALLDQRRRLFFSVDPAPEDSRRTPWNVTAYRHGVEYAELCEALRAGEGPSRDLGHALVKALNRVMTGAMTETDQELWLTAPSGVFLGQSVPLLVERISMRPRRREPSIRFLPPSADGHPPRLAMLVSPDDHTEPEAALHLTPLLVEGLLRIAGGALPSAMSNRLHQQIDRFRLHATAALEREANGELDRYLIETNGQELQEREIRAMEAV